MEVSDKTEKKTQPATTAEPARGTSQRKNKVPQDSIFSPAARTRPMTRATKASSAASEKVWAGKSRVEMAFHWAMALRHSAHWARWLSTSFLSFSVKGP